MTKAQFAKEEGHSEDSGSSDAPPVDADDDVATDTDEERSAASPALNALFTNEAKEIEQTGLEWSHFTAEQCRRAGKTGGKISGTASVGSPHAGAQQMGNGGIAVSGSVGQWWKVIPRRSRGQTRTTRGDIDPPQGQLARPVLLPVC
jgi:hypothetical protein